MRPTHNICRSLIQLCLQFDQTPSEHLTLRIEPDMGLVFHAFDGRTFADFRGFGGLWCWYHPLQSMPLLYVSASPDLARPVQPATVTRLARLCGYRLYVSLPLYSPTAEELVFFGDDPEELVQYEVHKQLVHQIYLFNEVQFRNAV